MMEALSDYYRVPEGLLGEASAPGSCGDAGFFRLGSDAACYGQSAAGVSARIQDVGQFDALPAVRLDPPDVRLPFDPDQIIQNLRHERYIEDLVPGRERFVIREWILHTYYSSRALIPSFFRRRLQRAYFSDWRSRSFPAWPVDFTVDTIHQELLALFMRSAGVDRVPFIWFWPEGSPSCVVMTHDVETRAGRDFTSQLMDLDDSRGIRASFQVIPEDRYEVPDEYVAEIRRRGFEFNIHDLNHDGRLYRKREEFLRRAARINAYGRKYKANGFRAGSMYRMLDWYDAYEFSYDMSLANVAHLEPKRGGCCTVFPFFIGKILEIPLTTSQDYSIFHILNEYSISLWKRQIDLLRERNGLISFIAHPDYLIDRRARQVYEGLIDYLKDLVATNKIWGALPGEVDSWWRARSLMKLVRKTDGWQIDGPEAQRARIAFAVLDGDGVSYEFAPADHHASVHP